MFGSFKNVQKNPVFNNPLPKFLSYLKKQTFATQQKVFVLTSSYKFETCSRRHEGFAYVSTHDHGMLRYVTVTVLTGFTSFVLPLTDFIRQK